MGNKGWIILSATLAIVAAIGGARAFPSGPSVSTGTNPIRYFQYVDKPAVGIPGAKAFPFYTSISKKKQVFEVPAGQTLVVTDFRVRGDWFPSIATYGDPNAASVGTNCKGCLIADGNTLWCTQSTTASSQESSTSPWLTGISVGSGAKVDFYLSNDGPVNGADATCAAVATGYLMRN